MSDDYDERQIFFERRTDKTIISKRFPSTPSGQMLRIATHIVQGDPGLAFAQVKDEIVLRQTPSGRYEIKSDLCRGRQVGKNADDSEVQ